MQNIKQVALVFLTVSLVVLSFVLSAQAVNGIGGWLEPAGTILLGSLGSGAVIALMTKLEGKNTDRSE